VCRASERRLQQAAVVALKLRSNVLILQRDMEEAQQQLHRNADHITVLQTDLKAEQSACAGAVQQNMSSKDRSSACVLIDPLDPPDERTALALWTPGK
jgi:hypothetical protein